MIDFESEKDLKNSEIMLKKTFSNINIQKSIKKRQFKIDIDKIPAQEIINSLAVKLSGIDIERPSLETAYINIIEGLQNDK